MEEKLMADSKPPNATQHPVASTSEPQLEQQSAGSSWMILLKALFWFIVAPAGVLLLARWIIQTVSGDPSFFGN
jgi:hypothetical protein